MTNIEGHGGALNALANYWLTRFKYIDSGETMAVPEFNLEPGASGLFMDVCKERGADFWTASTCGSAFEVGLQFADILAHNPIGCEDALRAALNEFRELFASMPPRNGVNAERCDSVTAEGVK